MARSKRRRRRMRRVLSWIFLFVVAAGALPGLVISGLTGEPGALWIIPAGVVGAVVAAPFLLIGLAVAIVSTAVPLAVMAAVLGGPLYLMYRLLSPDERSSRPSQTRAMEPALSPEAILRRRYVGGELTYQQFQSRMVDLLKERFARGELPMAQYEAELEKLLEPARRLDVSRDPTLAGSFREP
ncbi:MAG TPA: hypothetical protein VHS99_21495 [Chloroflexota bacterium]|nr:hypothetical protein [Chloroflexota bacterium]